MRKKISVGIPALNEQANIARLLHAVLRQRLGEEIEVENITIVATGSTDDTIEIVREFQKNHDIIKLVAGEDRYSNSPALNAKLNLIFQNAPSELVVVVNADTLVAPGTLARLVTPFSDEHVGASVGRAVPINDPRTMWGYVAHLLYRCNYLPDFLRVDFEGSCCVRRDLMEPLPINLIDNEPYLDALIRGKGYKIVHVPAAITYFRAPDNLRDFLNQRRRWFFAHLQAGRAGVDVSVLNFRKVIPALLRNLSLTPKRLFWFLLMLVLCAYCYALAQYDLAKGRSYLKWKMITSTKTAILKGDWR